MLYKKQTLHDTQKIIFASLMCHGRFQYRPAVYGFLRNLPVIFLHVEKGIKKAGRNPLFQV
jgi:hypothetical protein